MFRKKSHVAGWWKLWPETVTLLEQWRIAAESILNRNVDGSDRIVITQSGESMYKDESTKDASKKASKNAQSKFAKEFNEVRAAAKVSKLPLGTLRNQLPDWITTSQRDAVAGSVALAHGIPHKADKLLFAHYSNRPWKALFKYQDGYREKIFL